MLKTIIIDDEPHAREKLELLLRKYCKDVEIVATAKNADEGIAAINRHKPDLVFLDVEMPVLSGFDMLKLLPKIDFDIIFATAHDQYAIRAIKFTALDYLLKPIDTEQLQEAVQKAGDRSSTKAMQQQYDVLKENLASKSREMEQLAIPSQQGLIFIKVSDLIRCEADSNYTWFFLANKTKIVSSKTLKEYEEMLSDSGFVRIHSAHLINKKHLKQYIKGEGGEVLMNDGTLLDVSRRRKQAVMEALKN
jgi:two-component system LytT family response regulator